MTKIDYLAVFEALPSPYMLLDDKLCYVTANAAYLEATARRLEDIRGRHVMDVFPNPGESGRRLHRSFEKVLATGLSDTLAYLHYPIGQPDGSFVDRYWTCVHTPIVDGDGKLAFVMQNTVDVTEFARLRQAATLPFRSLAGEQRLLERTLEVEEANRELLVQSEDFRRLFQQAPGFFAVLSGPDHIFTFASDSYSRLVGGRQVVGLSVREALPEVVAQGFVELLDSVFRDGRTHAASGARVMLAGEAGLPLRETFLDFSYSPIRGADGTITGIFVQGTDQTDAYVHQRRLRRMLDELNHRVKNALATVQSIAVQSFREPVDPGRARQAFEARLQSLAGAHGMLSERKWEDAELGALVRQGLDAHGAERHEVRGPYVVVNSKAAIALALALHELSTNAARHGALSGGAGRVSVEWRIESERTLVINWQESGGPPVAQPQPGGFGARLIERVVRGELSGDYAVAYETSGFGATIRIPAAAYLPGEEGYGF